VDFTIADFAADVRAPTPTAAAELLARVKEELVARPGRAARAAPARLAGARREAAGAARRAPRPHRRSPAADRRAQLRLDKLQQRLEARLRQEAGERAQRMQALRTACRPRIRPL